MTVNLRLILPIFFLCSFVFALQSVQSTTYFVSSMGSDINNGLSPFTAIKSINRVNALTLQPGDSVLFRRGDVFYGEIGAKPGSLASPIVYGAYGSGNAPVIDGSTVIPVTGWTPYSGSIYMKPGLTLPAMTSAEPPQILWRGTVLLPARYPNHDMLLAQTAEGGNYGSHCCEFTYAFTDSALGTQFGSASQLEGALVTAYDPYGVSTRAIRSYDPGSGYVRIDTLRGASLLRHKMYWLSAGLALLDQSGEWYYSPQTGTAYIWLPGGAAPSQADSLCYTKTSYGINAWQVDNIAVQDLEFRYQQIAGISLVRSDNVAIERCAFHHAKHGIILWGTDAAPEIRCRNVRIEENTFRDLFRKGIDSRNLEECVIRRNRFENIAVINALGQNSAPDKWGGYGYYDFGTAIQASGIHSVIERNVFINTGRQSIAAGGPGVTIRQNYIDHPCMNYNDCGGIMPLGYSLVEQNIVANSIGPFAQYSGNGPRGIYPDFREYDTIRNNTIINAQMGIGLTNSKNEIVSGNTVYGSSDIAFRMNKKTAGHLNNTVTGNIFFGLDSAQHSFNWDNQTSERDISIVDSNRYWNPYLTFPTIKMKRDSASSEGWYDLASWQTQGYDRNSKKEFVSFAGPYRITDTLGANLVSNPFFDNGTYDWWFADSLSVVTGVLDGPCGRVKKNSTGQKILSTAFSKPLEAGRAYALRFTIADPSDIGRVNVRVKLHTSPYTESFNQWYRTRSARNDIRAVIVPSAGGQTRLEFMSSNAQYWIDNVELLPVEAEYMNPRKVFPIFVNPSEAPLTMFMGGRNWLTLDSNVVSGELYLPPYTSRILISPDVFPATAVDCPPLAEDLSFEVYPNPSTTGVVTLALRSASNGSVTVCIYDMLGRMIRSARMERAAGTRNHSKIMDGLVSGRYTAVAFLGDGKPLIQRFIVLR